jgi:hypothetical protein
MIKINNAYSPYNQQNDPGYPGGKAVPVSAGNRTDGTPWRALLFNDIQGFFQSMIMEAEGSFKVSGSPDKVGASDLLNALKKIAKAAQNPQMLERIETLEEYIDELELFAEMLPVLVREGPADNRLYGRKNKNWQEILIPESVTGDAITSKKFFNDTTIMLTNATTADRRLKHCDIGLPFLSPASEVYHFDTDTKNQNGGSSITIGYSTAPALVGREDSNGDIYMNPAVSDVAPYEPDGKSLYGAFDIKTKIPSENSTLEFWFRCPVVQNVTVFRLRTAKGEELVFNIGGPEPNYSSAAPGSIPYTSPAPGSIPYSSASLKQNRLEHFSQQGREIIPLASNIIINANSWIHIAAVATTQKLSLFINSAKIDVVKHNQALQDVDVIINEGRDTVNIDELNIDRTIALASAAFNANTQKYIPYAALDYTQKWSVLMFDNPNRVYTNLFESEQFKMAVKAAIYNSHD